MLPSWVIVLKLSKKFIFCNSVLPLASNLKSVETIYVYASKTSCYALSGNVIYLLYTMAYWFGGIRVWTRRIFDILIASISWMFVQNPINNILFWKSVMRTFRCNMQIALKNVGFLLNSAQNCKKCAFLCNLKTITQDGNMKTREMT